jgi:hypothetical protein
LGLGLEAIHPVAEPTEEELEAMVGTVRTDSRGLRYRVDGLKAKSQSRWSPRSVTVWGRCVEDKPQGRYANTTWYGAYCAEIFTYGENWEAEQEAQRAPKARTFTDGEGGTFTLEVNGATVTAKDVTEDGEEATATTFPSVEEAEAFVVSTVAELAEDGWTEQSE